MISNPILKEKYKAQEKIFKITKNNLKKYKNLFKKNISEIESKYNIKFKYSKKKEKVIQ